MLRGLRNTLSKERLEHHIIVGLRERGQDKRTGKIPANDIMALWTLVIETIQQATQQQGKVYDGSVNVDIVDVVRT